MEKNKTSLKALIGFGASVTLAYFIWLTWQKLTEWIGNSNLTWAITGLLVVLAISFGYLGLDKVFGRFK